MSGRKRKRKKRRIVRWLSVLERVCPRNGTVLPPRSWKWVYESGRVYERGRVCGIVWVERVCGIVCVCVCVCVGEGVRVDEGGRGFTSEVRLKPGLGCCIIRSGNTSMESVSDSSSSAPGTNDEIPPSVVAFEGVRARGVMGGVMVDGFAILPDGSIDLNGSTPAVSTTICVVASG